MNLEKSCYSIIMGKKSCPIQYAHTEWLKNDDTIYLLGKKTTSACLSINLPTNQDLFFMAEVTTTPSNKSQQFIPQKVIISVNKTIVGEWLINSTTIHDKLVIIPSSIIPKNSTSEITFTLEPTTINDTSNQGLCLHSITVSTNLDDYLEELQAGYNWVCRIRNELLDTITNVLFYLKYKKQIYSEIIQHLQTILEDPYVQDRHETDINFNEEYFYNNKDALKEGIIHQEIRSWAQSLQQLQLAIVEIGNHATRQTDLECFSPQNLKTITRGSLKYNDKIDQLRTLNETLNNLEIILQKKEIHSIPSTLYLDITNSCNFRCRMCYQSKNNFLQTSLINKHMAEVIFMMPYLHNITVAGLGEPLLGHNLEKFSESAQDLKCTVCIITNGSLIGKKIDSLNKFSKVSISFDGATAETFETLRHRSKFNQIIDNIRALRKAAPKLTIAFSVVVSRANIDELSGIAELATQLGVNEINLTPMEHIEELKLRVSDKSLFDSELSASRKITTESGISLSNSVIPASFSSENDIPRNKKTLQTFIRSLSTREEQSYNLTELANKLNNLHFYYYPNPIVFIRSDWPVVRGTTPDISTAPPKSKRNFNIEKDIATINFHINQLLKEIKGRQQSPYSLPYCLDPWKLNYLKSNGKSRLCCHADVFTGNLGEDGFKKSINSPEYKKIRHSMFNHHKLLPVCAKCRAADRFMKLESLKKTCEHFKITILEPKL